MIDWTSFTRKVRIKAPSKVVFDAWADCEQMVEWFLKVCTIKDSQETLVSAGDVVVWEWHNYPNRMEVLIKECSPSKHMVFTFGSEMEVLIRVDSDKDYTVLTLKQYNIPTDDTSKMNFYVGCSRAWSTWMLNLKSYLENKQTLHDTELGVREDLFDYINT